MDGKILDEEPRDPQIEQVSQQVFRGPEGVKCNCNSTYKCVWAYVLDYVFATVSMDPDKVTVKHYLC